MAKGFKSSTITFKAEMAEQHKIVEGINAKIVDREGIDTAIKFYRETRKGDKSYHVSGGEVGTISELTPPTLSQIRPLPTLPAPQPDPTPRAIMHPLPMEIMVVDVKRGKAVNTNTPPVIALYAHEADMRRAEVRLRHEQETGEAAPAPKPMDMGRPKFWMRNPDGTMEMRYVS